MMDWGIEDLPTPIAAGLEKARQALEGTSRVFFLDYPDHGNIGDALIWIGSRRFLQSAGIRVVGQVHARRHDMAVLGRILGDADIVLQGGGNFGDLYPRHSQMRREVISGFGDRKIFMFPQTFFFRDPSAVRGDQAVFGRHPALTLMWRDHSSLEMGRRHFPDNLSLLVPDMAFCLGKEMSGIRSQGRGEGTLFHDRSIDQPQGPETSSERVRIPGAERADWSGLVPRGGLRDRLGRFYVRAARAAASLPPGLRDTVQGLAWSVEARRRFRRVQNAFFQSCRAYRKFSLVVTNRLHGHILATLLRIPNILLDSGGYGKVRWFFETWTHSDPLARISTSAGLPAELERMYQRLRWEA